MTAPLPPNIDHTPSEDSDGVAALAGAAVAGLVLAMGFVALMARVGGPTPVQASVQPPVTAVAAPALEAKPPVPSLYDETGAH